MWLLILKVFLFPMHSVYCALKVKLCLLVFIQCAQEERLSSADCPICLSSNSGDAPTYVINLFMFGLNKPPESEIVLTCVSGCSGGGVDFCSAVLH